MHRLVQLAPLALAGFTTGCDDVEASASGLSAELYNPCGADVAREDCPGGKLAEGSAEAAGAFEGVNGSRGTHTLDVNSLGCSIELDSVGTPTTANLCPDCSLVLEMSHMSYDDGCNVGGLTYASLVGLVPRGGGDYQVYLSLDGSEWYAFGDGTVEDQVLSYSATSIYDEAYGGYYGATPAYAFTGDHRLTRN